MKFGKWPALRQWGVLMAGGGLAAAAFFFAVARPLQAANVAAQSKLESRLRENAELEANRPRLSEIEREVADLKIQIEAQRRIVPEDKEVANFLRMLETEGHLAGIEIRRYTALPTAAKEFYSEVPFELELDGQYYPVLNFFDRVAKLERIVNVSGLLVASTRKPAEAKPKKTYQYGARESVVATCTATTFFSSDQPAPVVAKPDAKPAKK